MSGSSDYTTTPNLTLFKPISNRAIGTWGDLWNSNADTLDATMANLSGGPFLPLTGGTVSGPLNVTTTGATRSWSVQDRFAEVIDVQDYGQIGTSNATIDTATMLAAVAALPGNGGVLKIGGNNPNGITLNQTITINKSCKILGNTANGWCSTIICQMSGPAIVFSDPTPSYQKTFECENVRFIANNTSGPTQSAIQVNIGPSSGQVGSSFIGRNLYFAANVATAAAPYARTFTRGIEFVPSSITISPGIHNFWNVVLENIWYLGTVDTATSNPIAGTAGLMFGMMIYGTFRNVNVSSVASGFRQTSYCEGITCVSCQLFTVTNGWDFSAFAPVGASQVKLLQPVMLGSMINAAQSTLALDCVYIGQFSNNYLQSAGATNVALSNTQTTQVCNNFLQGGTTGVAMTRAGFNEGGNLIACNIFVGQTTSVSLGSGTFDTVLDNTTETGGVATISDSGTNTVRNDTATVRTVGTPTATDAEFKVLGAAGQWRAVSIWSGTTAGAGQRWAFGALSGSETGSNAGSDFAINAFSDTGGNLGQPFIITRATGAIQMWNGLGLFGHAPVTARPTVSGAKGSNAALASLLTALAAYGLITDSTSA